MNKIGLLATCFIILNINNISSAWAGTDNKTQEEKPEISIYCGDNIPSKILEEEKAPENQCLNYIKIKDKSTGYSGIYYGKYSNENYCVSKDCTGQTTNNIITLSVVPSPRGCNYIIWGRKLNGKLEPIALYIKPVMEINYAGMQNSMPYFNIKYFKDSTSDLIEDVVFYSDAFKKYK